MILIKKICKRVRTSLKVAGVAALTVGATLTAFGQASVGTGGNSGSTYQPIFVPLPAATLATGAGTNFYNGWTAITSATNIQGSLYTNNLNGTGLAGFYSVTNIVFYTNTTFAKIFFPKQSRLSLEWAGAPSASGETNIFTFAKSVTGNAPDMTSQFSWAIGFPGGVGTNTIAVTNFPADFLGGEGYLFCINQTNSSGSGTITNTDTLGGVPGFYWGSKPNAP